MTAPCEEDPLTAALNLPDKQEWTVDDLASLPKDLRYELVDGRLILPSPTAIHQNDLRGGRCRQLLGYSAHPGRHGAH